jgi:predicted TIM-barrel fold metal-dependent hydrolase
MSTAINTFEAAAEAWRKSNPNAGGESLPVEFLEAPERRERKYLVISVDDHLVEPRDMFDGRLPAKYQDAAPRIEEQEDGTEVWVYDGSVLPNVGLNAVVGKPLDHRVFEPARYEDMIAGAWDINARVDDMDRDGVFASLCFPSFLAGFGGVRLQMTPKDKDLALAVLKAYNDWHLDGWAAKYPGRMIPQQVPWLLDPKIGAEEIRRNAARGFRAVAFPEHPDKAGLPSLYTDYWDPFFEACAETGTAINLHTGSSGWVPTTSNDAPIDVGAVLFGMTAVFPAVDWLYAQVPNRWPDIKIVLSEGGIGWVSGLLDRLEHERKFMNLSGIWKNPEMTPAEVLKRNFWFCALEDPNAFRLRDHIGVENILSEVDYPHRDSTWPETQAVIDRQMWDAQPDEIARMTWQNASEVYNWPMPPEVVADYEYFSADKSYSVDYGLKPGQA